MGEVTWGPPTGTPHQGTLRGYPSPIISPVPPVPPPGFVCPPNTVTPSPRRRSPPVLTRGLHGRTSTPQTGDAAPVRGDPTAPPGVPGGRGMLDVWGGEHRGGGRGQWGSLEDWGRSQVRPMGGGRGEGVPWGGELIEARGEGGVSQGGISMGGNVSSDGGVPWGRRPAGGVPRGGSTDGGGPGVHRSHEGGWGPGMGGVAWAGVSWGGGGSRSGDQRMGGSDEESTRGTDEGRSHGGGGGLPRGVHPGTGAGEGGRCRCLSPPRPRRAPSG